MNANKEDLLAQYARYQQTPTHQTLKKQYREHNDTYVVELNTETDQETRNYITKLAQKLLTTTNKTIKQLKNNIHQLKQNKQYKKLTKQYSQNKEQTRKAKTKTQKQQLAKEREKIAAQLESLIKAYKLDNKTILKRYHELAKRYHIPSDFAESRARDILKGVNDVLYSNGKNLSYRETANLPNLQGRKYNRALILYVNDKGQLALRFYHLRGSNRSENKKKKKKYHQIPLSAGKNDTYAQNEIQKIKKWLADPEGNDEKALWHSLVHDSIKMNTGRVCYASLVIKGNKIVAQLTVEGSPVPKKKADGSPRHKKAIGVEGGVDLGPRSIALTSDNGALLRDIGGKDDPEYDLSARARAIAEVERAMDRSRRQTNPENYNEDGTMKPKSERKPWIKSKRYKRLQEKRRKLYAGDAEHRRNSNRAIVNECLELAGSIRIEPSNAKALAKRAKKDPSNPNKRRRRFGRSISSCAPGQLFEDLRRSAPEFVVIDPFAVKASQYDPTDGSFRKHALDERWFRLSNGVLVQRDLFAAFVMEHTDDDGESVDRSACLADLSAFIECQDGIVHEMMDSGEFVCNSGVSDRGLFLGDGFVSFDEYFDGDWRNVL